MCLGSPRLRLPDMIKGLGVLVLVGGAQVLQASPSSQGSVQHASFLENCLS
jgi:hypothetical protein